LIFLSVFPPISVYGSLIPMAREASPPWCIVLLHPLGLVPSPSGSFFPSFEGFAVVKCPTKHSSPSPVIVLLVFSHRGPDGTLLRRPIAAAPLVFCRAGPAPSRMRLDASARVPDVFYVAGRFERMSSLLSRFFRPLVWLAAFSSSEALGLLRANAFFRELGLLLLRPVSAFAGRLFPPRRSSCLVGSKASWDHCGRSGDAPIVESFCSIPPRDDFETLSVLW